MSTQSSISILRLDGTVDNVYCHWDGGLDHNGAILYIYYDVEKTKKIMALGSLSALAEHVDIPNGVTHTFDKAATGVCVFYGRDRGEGFPCTHFDSLQQFTESYNEQQYNYLLKEKTGKWYRVVGNRLQLLRTLLIKNGPYSEVLRNALSHKLMYEQAIKENKALLKSVDKNYNALYARIHKVRF